MTSHTQFWPRAVRTPAVTKNKYAHRIQGLKNYQNRQKNQSRKFRFINTLSSMLQQVELASIFFNKCFQLATTKFCCMTMFEVRTCGAKELEVYAVNRIFVEMYFVQDSSLSWTNWTRILQTVPITDYHATWGTGHRPNLSNMTKYASIWIRIPGLILFCF